jgi:DNA-binding LytR/AlgR family response regulator
MTKIKVGIVEDELLIARSISGALNEIGYELTMASISYTEAIQMIETEKPDILLLDIQLSGKKDGIDVARVVNEKYHIPFIFLTANSDPATIARAKSVNPNAYLIKPFTKEELYASIEIAISNYQRNKQVNQKLSQPYGELPKYIFIRDHHSFQKIELHNILFIESEGNYVKLYISDGKRMLIRSTFTDFLDQLPTQIFFRTGRGYAIHLERIDKIDPTEIQLSGHKIPLSKFYRDELYKRLGIR